MAHYLPPAIMAFFQPRPAPEYKAPLDLNKKKMPPYQGIAQFVARFADPAPPSVKMETPAEKKAKRVEKEKKNAEERVKRQSAKYSAEALNKKAAEENSAVTKEAYKTLFVSRLAYDVTEDDLKKEFEYYGPIVTVKLIKDKKGKSRGYAFVEFESSRHLKEAYSDADGRKIHGRRILVDVERGRTVKNWKPRRLGGGLGATRAGGKDVNQKFSGREPETARGGSDRRDDRDRFDDRDRKHDDRRRDDRGGRDDRDRRDDRRRDDRGGDRDGGRRDDRRDERRHRSRSPRRDRERSRSRSRDRRR